MTRRRTRLAPTAAATVSAAVAVAVAADRVGPAAVVAVVVVAVAAVVVWVAGFVRVPVGVVAAAGSAVVVVAAAGWYVAVGSAAPVPVWTPVVAAATAALLWAARPVPVASATVTVAAAGLVAVLAVSATVVHLVAPAARPAGPVPAAGWVLAAGDGAVTVAVTVEAWSGRWTVSVGGLRTAGTVPVDGAVTVTVDVGCGPVPVVFTAGPVRLRDVVDPCPTSS